MSIRPVRPALAALVVAGIGFAADGPRLVIDSGGHQAMPRCLAFTRDGKSLVSAGEDKVVRIWDIASGKTVRTIRGQIGDGDEGAIYAGALSPDEHYLAVGGWLGPSPDYGVIRIHNFRTGNVVALLKGHTNVINGLAFSPDGRWLASGGSDNTVRIWDTKEWTLSGHKNYVYAVSFSPDGKMLVSGSFDKTLRLWDRVSGQLVKEMAGHQPKIYTASFSPDGRYIASGGDDRVVKLWDGHTGAFIRDLARQGSAIPKLAFSPDGRTLLTTGGTDGDYVCHIFEVSSGREISHFSGHTNTTLSAAFSPDGNMVATGGGEREEIFLRNPTNGVALHKLVGDGREVRAVGYGRDGKSIAFGTTFKPTNQNDLGPLEKTILLDQAQDHRITLSPSIQNPTGFVRAQDRVRDFGLRLKGGDHTTLQILQGGEAKHEIARDNVAGSRHNGYSLSPDGTLVASAGDFGVLTLYATTTGAPSASCVGHTSSVWAVAFSPDGKTLVSGSDDQTVRLWDITPSSCRNLLTIFVGTDNEWVAWTPQGYYTSSANGDKYIGWHINQGLDKPALFYRAEQFQKQFYRPDVVAEFLKTRDIDLAVRTANERRGGEARLQPVLTSANVSAWLPPLVSISSPASDVSTADGKTLRIRAEVLSNTLPISDVKVLLNGTALLAKGDSPPGAPMRRRLELEADLEDGTNILSIIASNEKAMSEPETRKIIYHSSSGIANKPKLIAVSIGTGTGLKYTDADAVAMEASLRGQLDPQHRLYSNVEVHVLTNEKASRKNILDELNWMNREATQRDTRVLFLSGHGAVDSSKNYFFFSHEHDPSDYELGDIPWDVIIRKLTATGRAILLVDSCHAGAVTGNKAKDDSKTLAQIIKEISTDQLGLVTFASSEGAEDSQELDPFKHGAFTQALIEGLNDRKADLNGDGVIETQELGTWIVQRVRELTGGKQHAVYQPAPGMSSFAIFRGKQ